MQEPLAYDVIVIGGGTAGTIAAIQAGRAGARTLLVEKTGLLGGTLTSAGMHYPGLFHAWGRQIIAGLGWELVERCVREAGDSLPDFTAYRQSHDRLQIRVNPSLYAALCDEAAGAAGVEILFHTLLADLEPWTQHAGWRITLCAKEGLLRYSAKVLIDATGDANAVALAGLPLNLPETNQPATLAYRVGGYDLAKLNLDSINRAFDGEVRAGRLAYTDASWNAHGPHIERWLSSHGFNSNHIYNINARDSRSKSRLELQARQSLLRLYRFLRQQPGLEQLVIEQLAPECGVRETITIQGKKTVTVQDYQSGRLWEDALCYAFYPIDLHGAAGSGVQCQPLAEGVVPTVPRGALLPVKSRYLLAAGRCLASDRLANSALRVQATCMATGQAAGALAALSAAQELDPEELPLEDVYALLRQHGAIIPGALDA